VENYIKMTYKETIDWLFSQLPFFQREGKAAYKANLDNTLKLDDFFNHPHKKYLTIHVAGTNGKGSVSHNIASILQEAGYKVGLYTSPHLKTFRERIKVNGEMISENYITKFISNNKDFFGKIAPSFFEMTVAMAFKYFADQEIDIAVIEVGLGGRLDSTNIITPEVSVITNIALDHTDLLGSTLPAIAKEKAGIIKAGIPAIAGIRDKDYDFVFTNTAKECNTSLAFASDKWHCHYLGDGLYDVQNNFKNSVLNKPESNKPNSESIKPKPYNSKSVKTKSIIENIKSKNSKIENLNSTEYISNIDINKLHSELKGMYQRKNIPTILSTIEVLQTKGMHITIKNVYDGIAKVITNTGLMGRWQKLSDSPLTICDTGHNVDGITEVVAQLKKYKEENKYDILHIVIGMVSDKDITHVLKLLPKDAIYYFCKASIPRAMNEKEFAEKANKENLFGITFPTVKEAYNAAKSEATPQDMIYIGGSTFIVAEVL